MSLRKSIRFWAPLLLASGVALGCSTSSDSATTGTPSALSGVVVGPSDVHCAVRPAGHWNPANCFGDDPESFGGSAPVDNGAAGGGGAGAGSGGADCNTEHDSGYGDTLYDSAGDDDECKYHVSWAATPIHKNEPFTLTVTASDKATGAPLDTIALQVAGQPALSRIEPYMPCNLSHHAPTASYEAKVTRTGPGTFSIGPVVFDESGRWIIRYHFYEDCFDSTTSPHGHIAFFVNVP